ncbi:BON domain-containing protein [Aliidiomarina soli]|uniref:Transporter n=1 Tax=Aliidiomarina soli TaxID=1928574 RepID=A0A432WIH6_9GAMM|nr:BON domain-containing protein [Aliidiomarina soli]RUO33626.1 transporter [Aliidiomarina soli]
MKRTLTAALVTLALGSASISAQANTDWEGESRDAWIHGSAQTSLMLNTNLNAFRISSSVEDGVVTLEGEVETSTDKALAEELVEGIEGVSGVENNLTVRNEDDGDDDDEGGVRATLNDGRIFTVLKSRLLMSGEISGRDIEVEVDEAVVTLNGHVESSAQRDLAVEMARNTNGVRDVRDNLRVRGR